MQTAAGSFQFNLFYLQLVLQGPDGWEETLTPVHLPFVPRHLGDRTVVRATLL